MPRNEDKGLTGTSRKSISLLQTSVKTPFSLKFLFSGEVILPTFGIMKITVNKEPIAFKLEEDITISEILEHIQDWAGEQDLFILNYQISPTKNMKDLAEKNLLSSQINSLNVEVGTQNDLYRENLVELDCYLERMGYFIAAGLQKEKQLSKKEVAIVREGLSWVIESTEMLGKQTSFIPDKELEQILGALQKFQKQEIDTSKSETTLELLSCLEKLKNYVSISSKISKFQGASKEELDDLIKKFKEESVKVLKSLTDIAADLTAGKEEKAIQKIEELVDFISDALSLLYQVNEHQKEKEKMVSSLNELTSALTKGDLVTSADIVDYDIRESLEKIIFDL